MTAYGDEWRRMTYFAPPLVTFTSTVDASSVEECIEEALRNISRAANELSYETEETKRKIEEVSIMAKALFKKGVDSLASGALGGGRTDYVKVKPGESVIFTPLVELDDLISVDSHGFWSIEPAVIVPCTHDSCPACELGNTPRYRAYMPVYTNTGDVQTLSTGISVIKQLIAIEPELDNNIVGKVFKLTRTGSGLSTRWMIMPLGKSIEIPDDLEIPTVKDMIGATTREEVVEALQKGGLVVPDAEVGGEDTAEDDDDVWDLD
jgi:hypothetical protein